MIRSLAGGGQPLPSLERSIFEPRFGVDFSRVRLHSGETSGNLAQSVQAKAFTLGSDIVFGRGRYAPGASEGKRLLAHELTHVVQQGGAVPRPTQGEVSRPYTAFHSLSGQVSSQASDVIQRAGDPAAIPLGLEARCEVDLTAGHPAGTDLLFSEGRSTITPAHTHQLTTFRAAWIAAGGTDDIIVHGYASTKGDQASNWTLSCDRPEAVREELARLGIPRVRIRVVAHGESTDFGAGMAPNQHAVVSTRAPGIGLPLVAGFLTPRDNFPPRSTTRFGVGEVIDLSFFSLPPRPAADFGGLEWQLAAGGGILVPGAPPNAGTATYTAPAAAGAVRLELRVAAGATAGRVISSHAITIVIPSGVRMVAVPGTAPDFAGTIPAGTWGAGFRANPFIDPRDVSFRGVMFGEGTVAGVVTPAGSFLSARHGLQHPVGGLFPGGGGNAATGTPVLSVDSILHSGNVMPHKGVLGLSTCGASDFLWAIPWEFSVAGGPRTRFATANQHLTSTLFCNATIEKAGAGPFCRRINGTTC